MRLKYTAFAASFAGLMMVGSIPASAQMACAPRDEVIDALGQKYDEAPVGIGLMRPNQVLELLVSDTGSWTLLVTLPTGRSCIMGAGENWETMTVEIKGDPV
ncbi:hypothetical protein [Microvirga roseola]|uniref:hypothetical protein n=1 Tax=Microvirga roseola TaxID=2883126 RepID=UPI001E3C4AF0|nr:hypothetical protein [Microvirga roseola]